MKKNSVNDLKIQEQCKLITEQEKELHNLQMKLSHKKAKAEQIKSEIASLPTSTNVSKSSTLKRQLSNPFHKGLSCIFQTTFLMYHLIFQTPYSSLIASHL